MCARPFGCSIAVSATPPFAPEKSVALAAEFPALHQSNPALVETLRAQADVCPACKRRAALERRGSANVHYSIERASAEHGFPW